MRTTRTYTIQPAQQSSLKSNILDYCARFEYSAYYDSNNFHYGVGYREKYAEFELLAAANTTLILTNTKTILNDVDRFMATTPDWLFGYLSYDLKNSFHSTESNNTNHFNYKNYSFFRPETVFTLKGNVLSIHSFLDSQTVDNITKELLSKKPKEEKTKRDAIHLKSTLSKEEYIERVNGLKQHIQIGDIYEVNLCQEFSATAIELDPQQLYSQLKATSPTPFSAWFRETNQYLLCASPERYIKKKGSLLFSQPIKGTGPRSNDESEDKQNLKNLLQSEKEISENVMIVDLVRNDLSRLATKGSVTVEECCEPYSFPHVYQLISTVCCQLRSNLQFSYIIKATFPMGSMTGAPKLRAMQLAETAETFQRGIYSGAVGYITPNGDFDFNVVIRSFVYNEANGYLSYSVGGAITMLSEAEAEYNECLVKAQAMNKTLETLNGTDFKENY